MLVTSSSASRVIEVVTAAKLITEEKEACVVIQDPEETATTSVVVHSEVKSKDKGNGILIKNLKPLKRQAQIEQDEAFAREMEAELNANINWNDVLEQARKNIARFKMDFFKGMTYIDIRPIFKKHYNLNQTFLERLKEEVIGQKEEGNKRKCDSLNQDAAKKQRIDKETEELKTHLQIVANDDDDDVYTEATILALKMILLVEKKHSLTRFTLEQMLNNVRLKVKEESEMSLELLSGVRVILKIVSYSYYCQYKVVSVVQIVSDASIVVNTVSKRLKEEVIGQKEEGNKRKCDSFNQDAAKKQRIDEETEELKIHLQIVANDDDDDVYTEATPLALKMILLVEKKHPLTRFTLEQMLNNVRLKVKEESEMSLELLRLIHEARKEAMKMKNIRAKNLERLIKQKFKFRPDGTRYFRNRVWLSRFGGLKDLVMHESHKSKYSIIPGSDKICQDLKSLYWWPNMKAEIAMYVGKCLTCTKVKAEHQKPFRLQQQQEIPVWMWERITMDFVSGFPRTTNGLPSRLPTIVITRALRLHYMRLCTDKNVDHHRQKRYADKRTKPLEFEVDDMVLLKVSPWKGTMRFGKGEKLSPRYIGPFKILAKVGLVAYTLELLEELKGIRSTFHSEGRDSQLIGLELIRDTTEKIIQIKNRLLTDRSRQKRYADKRTKPLEFEVDDMVLLKVSPWKGTMRFGKREKLSPRYIRPFKILAKVGPVAYTLELLEELKGIRSTFHVSNLKKCLAEGDIIVLIDEIQLDDKLHMIEESMEVVDREVKRLKQSRIPIVKVRWSSQRGPEARLRKSTLISLQVRTKKERVKSS
nr:putative reverse transcriptase domain-containing protein [Tanacetum cinerariifolium]